MSSPSYGKVDRLVGDAARRSEALLSRLELFGVRLGLEGPKKLLETLDSPHLSSPAVLIAGTNGKGSTAALLASICSAAGLRTGLYTSPHLETVTERLKIDGRSIEDDRLAGYLEKILATAEAAGYSEPTFFEVLTAAAFLYFRETAVDLAVMEVGLGGRLDATNISEPIASLITSISLDHERHLGSTLESVAREKSGIFRHSRPAIAWATVEAVRSTLKEQAADLGTELILAEQVVETSTSTSVGACPQRVRLRTPREEYALDLQLAGPHQLRNLAIAVLAAEILCAKAWPAINTAAIESGVARCRWPGRLEWLRLKDGRWVLLDAAHNSAGIEALADYLRHLGIRPYLLFGALAEKSIDAAIPQLAALTDQVIVTRPPKDGAAEPQRWLPFFGNSAQIERDFDRALHRALSTCKSTLVVCGSMYLVGAVRKHLRHLSNLMDNTTASPSFPSPHREGTANRAAEPDS